MVLGGCLGGGEKFMSSICYSHLHNVNTLTLVLLSPPDLPLDLRNLLEDAHGDDPDVLAAVFGRLVRRRLASARFWFGDWPRQPTNLSILLC